MKTIAERIEQAREIIPNDDFRKLDVMIVASDKAGDLLKGANNKMKKLSKQTYSKYVKAIFPKHQKALAALSDIYKAVSRLQMEK